MTAKKTIGIIGAGAWGTALALTAHRAKANVLLWSYKPEHALHIKASRHNVPFLPQSIKIPEDIMVTSALADLKPADMYILATPAQASRATLKLLCQELGTEKPVILTAKGIEKDSLLLLSQVAQEVAPTLQVAALSGPSFAIDVAYDLPTAIVLAAQNEGTVQALRATISTKNFRVYASTDVVGVQVGGAIKNVLAIAAGIAWGLNLGDNARAALLTRGLAELTRLGLAMGGRVETFTGLAGMGDLILTASSLKSRNMSLGVSLAQKATAKLGAQKRTHLAEGLHTAATVHALIEKYNVSMPISEAMYRFFEGQLSLEEAIDSLLQRPLGWEQ